MLAGVDPLSHRCPAAKSQRAGPARKLENSKLRGSDARQVRQEYLALPVWSIRYPMK